MGYLAAPTYSPAQTVASADWNTYVRDNIKALASKCLLYYGATFALTASTTGQLTLNTKQYDSLDVMGDPTTNFRITIKQAGTYRILAEAGAPAGGGWTVFVKKNGTSTILTKTVTAGLEISMDFAASFAVNDYVELWFTVGGANITGVASITRRPPGVMLDLGAEWVAP